MENISQETIDYIKHESGCNVKLQSGPNYTGIIVEQYKLPNDLYSFEYVDILVVVPNTYPRTQLDMFYTSEILLYKKSNLRPKQTQVDKMFFEKRWQRWSRHYRWDPNSHNIITHLNTVFRSLEIGQNS